MTVTAVFVLVRHDQQVLMEWREDFYPPGAWMFLGGKVEDGESYVKTMLREAQEEVGVTVRGWRQLPMVYSVPPWVNVPFLVDEWSGSVPDQTDTGDRLAWKTLEEAAQSDWPASREIARLVQERLT